MKETITAIVLVVVLLFSGLLALDYTCMKIWEYKQRHLCDDRDAPTPCLIGWLFEDYYHAK